MARLEQRLDKPLGKILTTGIKNHSEIGGHDAFQRVFLNACPELSEGQVNGAWEKLEKIAGEMRNVGQRFLESTAWCLGARSTSRMTETPAVGIDCLHDDYDSFMDVRFDTRKLLERVTIASVLGYLAAEGAVKDCFAECVPGGNVLVEGRTQAPPLPAMGVADGIPHIRHSDREVDWLGFPS